MLAIFVLVPLVFAVGNGLAISILALRYFAQKKPWAGKNSLACFLWICLVTFIWIFLIGSIHVGSVGTNSMEGYPALLLKAFMIGLTPITALPALMAYGPGKK